MDIISKIPLNGYKTALFFAIGVAVLGLSQLGYIDQSLADAVWPWVELGFGGSLAHKVAKAISE